MPQVGDTFLVPSGPGEFRHLFVVCTGPAATPDFRLVVSITSIHSGIAHDPACVILPGEHPFIRHPSYVAYRHADRKSGAQIDRHVASGYFTAREQASVELTARIIAGFRVSDFAAPWTLAMLRDGGA